MRSPFPRLSNLWSMRCPRCPPVKGTRTIWFLMLEGRSGCRIVTERLHDGAVLWEEDPEHLECRISNAKVFSTRCLDAGSPVKELKAKAAGIPHSESYTKVM